MGRSMLRPYKAKGPRKRVVREGSEEHSQEWLCHTRLKMPGFPTGAVGTPTNREKARRYIKDEGQKEWRGELGGTGRRKTGTAMPCPYK